MSSQRVIGIEVVFALPDRQALVSIDVADGTDCIAAIRQAGIAAQFPDHEIQTLPIAIWGRLASHTDVLTDGDRVEILRPLLMDPRDSRRQRATAGQFMDGSAGGDD
jgi:hypothetical protein